MLTPPMQILVAILGGGSLVGVIMAFVQFMITRNDRKKMDKDSSNSEIIELIEKLTLRVNKLSVYVSKLTYSSLSNTIERYLNQGYCTPEQRHGIEEIKAIYDDQGFNGDMNARLKRLYEMPTKKLESENDEKNNI